MFNVLFSECVFSILLLISFVQYLYHYLFSLEVFKNTLVDRKMEQGLLLNMHFKDDLLNIFIVPY